MYATFFNNERLTPTYSICVICKPSGLVPNIIYIWVCHQCSTFIFVKSLSQWNFFPQLLGISLQWVVKPYRVKGSSLSYRAAHFCTTTKFTFYSQILESKTLNFPFASLSMLESIHMQSKFALLIRAKVNIDQNKAMLGISPSTHLANPVKPKR